MQTKRAERIQTAAIDLPFRTPEGQIVVADVWREDILEWHPDDRFPSQWYLVLDFGIEQRWANAAADPNPDLDPSEWDWENTGRVQLDLQPLAMLRLADWDPANGEGLGPPVHRFADVPTDELGDYASEEPRVGRPMVGWIRHAVSPRRET